jgi:GNAT superfamily N-acetyltransferase
MEINMNITKATLHDLDVLYEIIQHTISAVYPDYYPTEVVDFFLTYHNKDSLKKDIEKDNIYLLSVDEHIIGTGSVEGRYIGRVYILPEFQGRGYGSKMMNVLEEKISNEFNTSFLDASLTSYDFYLKRGYKPTEYLKYEVENHRMLCYYVMEKELGIQ